jgi:hypothetical protein
MSEILLETIQTLHHRADRLEREAAELRQEIARIEQDLKNPSSVVARYVINGETYEITRADVEEIKVGLIKPRSESAMIELAAAKKLAKKLRELPEEERKKRFFETVEAIRAEAIANGTAIDTEEEAARGD